ncbi:MAG: SCO6745 family protein, partial [Acidimicrobiales bacterium]
MTTTERRARRLGAASNAAHGFVYFAPETTEAYNRLGLAEHQHYFASRAAPLGSVEPGVVEAVFFNFAPERVQRAIPSAWAVAAPAAVQKARLAAVGAVIERIGGIGLTTVERDEATDLLSAIINRVGFAGRPLAAANRDV